MATEDPGLWKQAAEWLWAVLALPIATLWRKADNAVAKDDFKEYAREAKEERKEIRETMAKIFDKIDEVKQDTHDRTERLMVAINQKADK